MLANSRVPPRRHCVGSESKGRREWKLTQPCTMAGSESTVRACIRARSCAMLRERVSGSKRMQPFGVFKTSLCAHDHLLEPKEKTRV